MFIENPKIGYFEKLFSESTDLYESKQAQFYGEALYERITSLVPLEEIEIISFDVFDTLLLRNNKYELYRFLEMSEILHENLTKKGIESLSVWDIYAARLTAFKTCYRTVTPTSTIREGRLIDVMSLMAKILDLDVWIVPEMVRIELTYEQKNLRVNPILQSFLNHPEIKQKKIIFISDMYISGDWINQLVKLYYPDLDLLNYYSSADYSLTKSSGLLYDKVIQDLQVSRSAMVHLGDNLYSDVQQAKERGIRGIHLPIPDVILKQRKIEKKQFEAELIAQGFDISLVR